MKHSLILALAAIFLAACEKDNNNELPELQYDFRIIRNYHIDYLFGAYQDSTIYYYSNDFKLIAADIYAFGLYDRYYVTCKPDHIVHWDGTYYLGEENRIDSLYKEYNESVTIRNIYQYAGDRLIHEEYIHPEYPNESFYLYENGNHVMDSVVDGFSAGATEVTAYIYSDTLKPFFMVDRSGLFEYPGKSDFLIREESIYNNPHDEWSDDSYYQNRHTYEIMDSSISETILYSEPVVEVITYLLTGKD